MSSHEFADRQARDLWLARLARGESGRLTVRSGSMAPLLRPGDVILVRRPPRRLWPGDLVVFAEADRLICHRLMLWRTEGRYWQKGDFNLRWENVDRAAIMGVPEALLQSAGPVPLQGFWFQCWNRSVWALILVRDLVRLVSRVLPRGGFFLERLFSCPLAAMIRRVRKEEDLRDQGES